ncbi:hypothetical protein K402DRAFT_399495 [Aulographum hederae CBS 113979]|uniref:Uncharacterized protein n=1 Tax=Aulographum hederae CBS 113979 TaxID=1176131 RepID=A0A6G1HHF9_9PEZI|nr:hypothetical protein K402DRAFT_399495 [Aulographum hederae CBS 113979]
MSKALTTPAALTIHPSDPTVNVFLGTLCVTVEQREVHASIAHDIEIIGSYDADKIRTRPSYVCGILIQSRGDLAFPPCNKCQNNGGKFGECRRIAGYWKGACGSCRWKDHSAQCSLVRENEAKKDLSLGTDIIGPSRVEEVDEDEDEDDEFGSSYEHPIEID